MQKYKLDNLSLLRGRNLKLTDDVFVIHPSLGDIEEIGYEKYSEYLFTLISTSLDVADILWFEMEIWYEDIKSEWDFFIQKSLSRDRFVTVKIIDSFGKLNRVEDNCLTIEPLYRDTLNFFLGLNGEYIVLEQQIDNVPQMVIYNIKSDKYGDYYVDNKCFKFTNFFYEITTDFLKKINWITLEYDFVNGGNKRAKKYILKNNYNARKRNKEKKSNITLDSVVSSLITRQQDAVHIWDYSIYLVYSVYYRLVKIDEYKNTVNALYSGCIDTKKNPINWEKINWSSII